MLRLVIALLLVLSGCVGSPVPEPPNLDPPVLERVTAMPGSSGSSVLVGAPGAAEPGAFVWGWNLDSADPPAMSPVGGDGSFMLFVAYVDGDELRLSVRDTAGNRSRPVDVITPEITETMRPLAGCLSFAPPLELDFGARSAGDRATAAITVDNRCGSTVTIDAVRPRAGSASFETTVTTPFDVADGASTPIEVTFAPAAPGEHEEILFIEVGAPSMERRPITLIGSAR